MLISLMEYASDLAHAIAPLLIYLLPYIDCPRELFLVVDDEPVPDEHDSIGFYQILLLACQAVISENVETLKLYVLLMHLGQDARILRNNLVWFQRVAVPLLNGCSLLVLSQPA